MSGILGRTGVTVIDAWSWRHLILRLARAEISREHARLAFGGLWWILDALLYLGVYTVLITVILDRGGPDYPLFIFGPLLAWKWLSLTIAASFNAVVGNDRLVRQIAFPRIALPLARLLLQAWRFVGGIVVLLAAIALIWPDRLTIVLLWVPMLAVAQLILMTPFAIVGAAITVFFRDTATLARHILRFGLYLSPVLYSLDQAVAQLPEPVGSVYALNPLALLLEGYRSVTYFATAPTPESILMPIGTGLVLIVPASVLFSVLQPRFAKRL